jgi:hypothetical protein
MSRSKRNVQVKFNVAALLNHGSRLAANQTLLFFQIIHVQILCFMASKKQVGRQYLLFSAHSPAFYGGRYRRVEICTARLGCSTKAAQKNQTPPLQEQRIPHNVAYKSRI